MTRITSITRMPRMPRLSSKYSTPIASTTMKQKLLYIIMFITSLAWSMQAWGGDLPMTLSSSNYNSYKVTSSGALSWDGGIKLGDGGGGFNWDDKYYIFKFTGIPEKLTFNYEAGASGASGVYWYVATSSDGSSYSEKWTSSSKSGRAEITLDLSVRYIKLCWSGNFGGYFKNVTITEHPTEYTINNSSLDFGTKTKGATVASQSVTLTHVNAAASTTVTCSDNANFTVSPTTIATGKDKWGTQAVSVTYKNVNVGSHNAIVTISDGTNTKTVSVSGTTQTTYYGQATAVASAGGAANVSFTSYDAATSSNATTSTANTTATSESKTAYYKAIPNAGYAFKGWIKGTGSYSSANVVSESLTYNPSVTYNSETSGNPSVTTYKAWFAPRFFFSASATSNNVDLGTANVDITEEKLGSVGATSGTVNATATFTATPNDDCVFLGWYTSNTFTGDPISTSTTYTEDLTNSVVGSTVSATPLYALFKKKQNLKWVNEELDLNLVLDVTGQSSAASVTSGKTITYTSSNENALTIAADGSITTIGLGSSTVTASVAGDDVYRAETISRVFNVGERKQATFTPSWGETTNPSLELGESATISLINVNENFTVTKEGNSISWERTNANTITISALSAGTTILTLSQPGDGVFLDGNIVPYTITVIRHPNTFAVADESKAMKVGETWTDVITDNGNGNTQVSYSTDGIATYDATTNSITAVGEGSTNITFTQAATATHAATTKTIALSVTKVANTLAISLPTQAAEVDGTIALSITGQNNADAIVGTITDTQLSSSVNNGSDVITYANGIITARNAGTAKITFSQPATTKYTAYTSDTYTITVSKCSNTITVTLNGGTATNIKLKYGATASLAYTRTNMDTSPIVTRASGSYTTLSGSTITAGNTAGTDIYEVRQVETYKYEAGYASFTIRVNNTDEAVGYVLYDETQYSHGTGSGVMHQYTLSGPGETLYYTVRRQTAAIYYHMYVEYYSEDSGDWVQIQDNQNIGTDWKDFSVAIPETARSIRFRFPAGGDLTKYIKNVYVPRKTYVRASSDKTAFGTVYTDVSTKPTATFTVNYSSTNGGNISINSSNLRFTPSVTELSAPNNSDGTQIFTVTYTPDPDQLGEESAVITIGDLFYSQQITLTATSKKYDTTIARGSSTATATTVDGIIENAFAFSGTSTAAPSADSNADFYYTISHTQTSGVNNGTDVISYDPSTNTVTGKNQGTARLTIYQKKTNLYNATSQTFDFTVSKLDNNTVMALSTKTLNVDGTATVELMNADSDGALSATYSNVAYSNESQNREGGLLSLAGNTLTGVNAGTGTVTITQAETYKYVAKSQSFDMTVNKLPQTLTWDSPDLETTMQVGSTLEGNTASSDVRLTPVTYSSGNTAAITVDANTGVLTAVATGSNIVITASQAGNYKYLPATLTRQFSVFNKQTPAFAADAHFTGANGRIEYSGTATITVTGVGADDEQGFTITTGDNSTISVVRNGETITITGLATGNTTLTLAQAGNNDFIAKSQTYTIEVYWPDDFLALSSTVAPTHTAGTYRKVFLNTTLKSGYSTIALPFDTDVETLTGRETNADDWVAQLSVVTYNAQDGYSLYFSKSNAIEANQPYILHLGTAIESPVFTDVSVVAAATATQKATKGVHVDDWTMYSNYDPAFDMNGCYGVVGEQIKKGSAGSTLKAFHAYIVGPTSAGVKAAYLEEDEADAILELLKGEETGTENIYDLQGRQLPRACKGINIIRNADGTVRKVLAPNR